MPYIPHSPEERRAMLASVGHQSIEELFTQIPEEVRFPDLDLPPALSEPEIVATLRRISERNADLEHHPCFLGAGAYRHFIPSVVGAILSRGEFYTAYTPYQPEIAQGTLQATYEYQSLLADLTGMDVANASVYDGASGTAEAVLMAMRVTRRDKVALSRAVHPQYRDVVRTYLAGLVLEPVELDYSEVGTTALDSRLDGETACLVVQYPNFFGCLEPLAEQARAAHEHGALLVVVIDPVALALFTPPGELGADIVVGEGQSLGVPLAYGGPYLGLLAAKRAYLRQLPGRIAGMTTDLEGRRGFVLTLQAREQHIRREKATSNICTNESLIALAATVHLAVMGKHGLRRAAELSYHKAHYLAARLAELPGFELAFPSPFFKEFLVRTPLEGGEMNRRLWQHGIVGGYDIGQTYPELAPGSLLCVTELNTRQEMDELIEALC